MKTKILPLLLALLCLLMGCSRQVQSVPGETNSDLAGDDWRTWGWVDDWGIIETQSGEQVTLLLCVFTQNAVLYYDDAAQREFADLHYPYEIPDAQTAYASFSLLDQNGDGSSDVRLLFLHDDGTQTELIWCWDGEAFVFDPALSGKGPAGAEQS